MFSLRTVLVSLSLALAASPLAAISISQFNVTYTEDFDTLATTTSSVMPSGWEFSETGSGANTTYGAGTGSSSTGNTYSFGTSSDRALGMLRTSSVVSTIGTVITNDTGSTITQLTVQFTGEQWRLGALGRVDQLDFSYSLNATSVATGTWIDVDALDFVGPTTTGVTGALDGNAAENRAVVSYTLTGLNLAPGASLYFRWSDFDASGSDDGLAIDDFSISSALTSSPQNVPDGLPLVLIGIVFGGVALIGTRIRTFPSPRTTIANHTSCAA